MCCGVAGDTGPYIRGDRGAAVSAGRVRLPGRERSLAPVEALRFEPASRQPTARTAPQNAIPHSHSTMPALEFLLLTASRVPHMAAGAPGPACRGSQRGHTRRLENEWLQRRPGGNGWIITFCHPFIRSPIPVRLFDEEPRSVPVLRRPTVKTGPQNAIPDTHLGMPALESLFLTTSRVPPYGSGGTPPPFLKKSAWGGMLSLVHI